MLCLGEGLMRKQYIVRLTDEEHKIYDEMIGKPLGRSQNTAPANDSVRHRVDADGPI